MTCAECTAFKNVQAFNITAFTFEVSEPRTVSGNKRVRDIKIIDGSVDTGVPPPEGQPRVHNIICPKVSVFYNVSNSGEDPALVLQLIEAAGKPQPFHFYGITAQKTKAGIQFETMRSWYKAPADGPGHEK